MIFLFKEKINSVLESYNEAETERHDTWDSVKNEIGAHCREMDELKAAILTAIGEENKESFQDCVQVNFWVFFLGGGGVGPFIPRYIHWCYHLKRKLKAKRMRL